MFDLSLLIPVYTHTYTYGSISPKSNIIIWNKYLWAVWRPNEEKWSTNNDLTTGNWTIEHTFHKTKQQQHQQLKRQRKFPTVLTTLLKICSFHIYLIFFFFPSFVYLCSAPPFFVFLISWVCDGSFHGKRFVFVYFETSIRVNNCCCHKSNSYWLLYDSLIILWFFFSFGLLLSSFYSELRLYNVADLCYFFFFIGDSFFSISLSLSSMREFNKWNK